MNDLIKNISIAIVLAALAWFGYSVFLAEDDPAITKTGELSPEVLLETQDLISQLKILESISIDSSITTDPRFNSLTDFRQAVEPEESGRRNPFAPLQ